MDPVQFAAKWGASQRNERAAAQEHFIDLCRMVGVPTPNEADPTGDFYAFEKGAGKLDGGDGFADVWKRDYFAWEYKGKKKDLAAAYRQLVDYKDALENPPILVVCDLDRFEVHTNFTRTAPVLYAFNLHDLETTPGEPLRILRALMTDPEELKPRGAAEELTAAAAGRFAELAQALRARDEDPQRVARFLDRLLFLLFAEDTSVLPRGLLGRLMEATDANPDDFAAQLRALFGHIAVKGGFFGAERVPWINGSLFSDDDVLTLTKPEIKLLIQAGMLDWSKLEPSIFGTLFERGLDPGQRSALGAHFTSAADIERVVEPVVMVPLRREASAARMAAVDLLNRGGPGNRTKALALHHAYLARLRAVHVLDPACGSGNFLYIALRKLKDLELEQALWASSVFSIPISRPEIGPQSVLGIEINPYAAELARLVIWIGDLQWMIGHSFGFDRDPVLKPIDGIRTGDALLDLSDPTRPQEVEWPAAEFIIGNPPFLGNRLLRRGLGDTYAEALWSVYDERLPRSSDLCCYWHEKARETIASGNATRAGLLATQGIRGQANRRVLERINESGAIFYALSDEPWVLAGAAVRISVIGQDRGVEPERTLDGVRVLGINPDLTTGIDLTLAGRLAENLGTAFMGDIKSGPFDVSGDEARRLLDLPNPDGRSNRDVVLRWANGLDLVRRPRDWWIIDFGVDCPIDEAALWEAPFEIVRARVKPFRDDSTSSKREPRWWLHLWPRPEMRRAIARDRRYIATPRVSKHRVFVWMDPSVLPDSALVAIARDDDFTMGVLSSRVHTLWALAVGTQLESRPRYTASTCFETFAFPGATSVQREAVGVIAAKLIELRVGWIAADPARTLTGIYNKPPAWLTMTHQALDAAVLACYGLPADASDPVILAHLLGLNLERSGAAPEPELRPPTG